MICLKINIFVLSATTCVIFDNLVGCNFSGKEYRDYIKHVAYAELEFSSGSIERDEHGHLHGNRKSIL